MGPEETSIYSVSDLKNVSGVNKNGGAMPSHSGSQVARSDDPLLLLFFKLIKCVFQTTITIRVDRQHY